MESNLQSIRDFSLSFQNAYIKPEVSRQSLVEEIEELVVNDGKCLIIEGSEGIGKTSVLMHFASLHKYDSFCYFINPSYSFTSKLDYLMEDLGKQVSFYVYSSAPDSNLDINEGLFSSLIFKLVRSPGKKNKPVFFVLDGLDQMSKADFELIRPVVNNLPWDTNNFYFIISGDRDKLKDIIPESAYRKSKSLRITRFSLEEAQQLFSDCGATSIQIKDIYNTWSGHPERLAQIKRIIDSGIDVESFLTRDDLKQKNDLLNAEWEQSGLDELDFSSNIIKILSVLCFDENSRNIQKIARILSLDNSFDFNSLNYLTFIYIKNNELSFASHSIQKLTTSKLKKYENNISNLLIAFYSKQENFDSVLSLSSIYAKRLEWGNIIKLLTLDNIRLIISESKSLSDIRKQINNGFLASNNAKTSTADIVKFSLYRSTLLAFQRSDTKDAQLKAYVALGKQDEAISLISSTPLKEDRLKMFIAYSKELSLKKEFIDSSIKDEIKELLSSVDIEYIKENVTEIVLGLAHVLPEESVQLVEKLAGFGTGESTLEWLLGYVSMIASKNKKDGDSTLKFNNKIYNTTNFTESFAKSIGLGVSEISGNDIIKSIDSIEGISDKVYMIRRWIKANPSDSNIIPIVDYALDLLLTDSLKVKPTTDMLLDISYPLHEVANEAAIRHIISRLESIMLSVTTPTDALVQLKALIIESLFEYDSDGANTRALKLYESINLFEDISSKVLGLANCLKLTNNIISKKEIYRNLFLLETQVVKQHLEKDVDKLLETAAEQFEELSDSLEILAAFDFDFAIEIAMKLNTHNRRSSAVLRCLSIYLDNSIAHWNIQNIRTALLKLDKSFYEDAVLRIFDAALEQVAVSKYHSDKIAALVPVIQKIDKNNIKAYLLTQAIALLSNIEPFKNGIIPNYSKLKKTLSHSLDTFYNKIDTTWSRIEAGYRIAADFAKVDYALADKFLNDAEKASNEIGIDSITYADIIVDTIRLAIRAYAALLKNVNKGYTYSSIARMISHIPSEFYKAALWSELAFRAAAAGSKDVAEEVITNKILPKLEKYKSKDKVYFYYFLRIAASAINSVQPATLKIHLKDLDVSEQEEIVSSVLYTILTKCYEADPFDGNKGNSDLNYQDIIDYIGLLDYITTDNILYWHISNICSLSKKTISKIGIIQRDEVVTKLTGIIKQKLPNPSTGVKHEGFAIVAEAAILQYSSLNYSQLLDKVDKLESRANLIYNTADRSYILSLLAVECSSKKKKLDLINRAFIEADKIIAIREKIQRYETILDVAYEVAPDLFKLRLAHIHNDVYKLNDSDRLPTYQKLIDLAYKYDKGVAQKLVSDLDNDPARDSAGKHLNKLETENKVFNDYSKINSMRSIVESANIAWRMLGQLNAGTRNTREVSQTVSIINRASRTPSSYAMPLYEFFIENMNKLDKVDNNIIKSVYEAACDNNGLCLDLAMGLSDKKFNRLPYHSPTNSNIFIAKPGFRTEALEFIGNYLKESDSKDIYIIDPYFSTRDIEFINHVAVWCRGAKITVLTSCQADGEFSEFAYLNTWRQISAEDFPASEFVSVSTQLKKSPFHDRWILLYDKLQGLKLGTSINGIGDKMVSEISPMFSEDVKNIFNSIVVSLVKSRSAEFGEHIIKYNTFQP